jgi:hypothetical protein
MSFGMSSSSAHTDSIDMNVADNFDFQKRHHFESSHKLPTACKRKCNYDEVSLSEQIKRFRITSTPGELRYT